MSDKPEEPQQGQGSRKHQPSFEEVLQGVSVEEKKPEAPPKRSAQPTFEEILAGAQAANAPAWPSPPERKSRPPRAKEERKMPIVVRKPTLGVPAAAESQPPALAAEAPAAKAPED